MSDQLPIPQSAWIVERASRPFAQIVNGRDARSTRKMKPLHFLITAGPTRGVSRPIRYISNRSSGKMATRWHARRRDADVSRW